jgi:hypothetical protein
MVYNTESWDINVANQWVDFASQKDDVASPRGVFGFLCLRSASDRAGCTLRGRQAFRRTNDPMKVGHEKPRFVSGPFVVRETKAP